MAMQRKRLHEPASNSLHPHPAPTRQVSTGNLERVRKVKTRHQRLTIRCETLRDELERFLHDDDDMVKMCLSRRKELEGQYRAVRHGGTAGPPCPSGGASHEACRLCWLCSACWPVLERAAASSWEAAGASSGQWVSAGLLAGTH